MPSTSPALVANVESPPTTLAIPKSVTFKTPSDENMRFSGLTSRCKTFFSCAACKPAEAANTVAHAAGGVNPLPPNRLQTVPPGSSSITSKQRPSFSTKSKTGTTWGWSRAASKRVFGDKTRPNGRVRRKGPRELLDCDSPAQGAVLGRYNYSPRTAPKLIADLITR